MTVLDGEVSFIAKGEYMPKLNWKLLTKKRGSSTQGLPSGKEDLGLGAC
jgi:hypothetical protein